MSWRSPSIESEFVCFQSFNAFWNLLLVTSPFAERKFPRSPSKMRIPLTILCAESLAFGKPFIVGHEKVIPDLLLQPFGHWRLGARCFNPRCRHIFLAFGNLGYLGRMTFIAVHFGEIPPFAAAFPTPKTSRPRLSCVCQHWMAAVGYSPSGWMIFRTWR